MPYTDVYTMNNGTLVPLQPPTINYVELSELKAFLNVVIDEDDAKISALRDAAENYLDGRDGILGRALRPQQWRLDLPGFPSTAFSGQPLFMGAVASANPIVLPLPPTQTVDSIQYRSEADNLETLDPSAYNVAPGGTFGDMISPVSGSQWPTTNPYYADAVQVTFTAGYEYEDSPTTDGMPSVIKTATMILAQTFYDHSPEMDIPEVVMSLIAPYRLTYLG